MGNILIGVAVLAMIGLVLGFVLAYFNEVFHVEVDTRIEDIQEMLPGVNCGSCGYPGCGGFASAIVEGKVGNIGSCKPASKDAVAQITEYLKNQTQAAKQANTTNK